MQWRFVFLLCALSAGVALAGEPVTFESAYKTGMEKMQAKQWQAARDAFAQAIASTKKHNQVADAELHAGQCLLELGDKRAAHKSLVNSMRFRYYSAARIYRYVPWAQGFEEYRLIFDVPATESAETVIFKALAELGMARMLYQRSELADARAHYLKALEWLHAPEVTNKSIQQRDLREAHLGLAEVCMDQRDYPAAHDALSKLLAIQGTRTQDAIKQRLWGVYRLMGGYEKIRAETAKVLAAADSTPQQRVIAQMDIAYTYVCERRYPEARDAFAKVLTMDSVTPAQRSEAQLYVAHTLFVGLQYAQARAAYDQVLKIDKAAASCVTTARERILAIGALVEK